MPAPPGLIGRLMAKINDPDSSVDEVAKILGSDPTSSVRLLKLANSAFYGMMGKISTVQRAVVVLGFKTVYSLVVTIWTHTLAARSRDADEFRLLSSMFAHGLTSAISASLLVRSRESVIPDDAFMAGLLHDIGRTALVCQLGKDYEDRVLLPAEHGNQSLTELELSVLGFSHTELGAELMSQWHLPQFLSAVAARHHDAEIDRDSEPLLAAVMLADSLATVSGSNVAPGANRPDRTELRAGFGVAEEEDVQAHADECQTQLQSFLEALR
ncbi:MAG: HDOD domain-containing protein [Deltaproteobacteria bacterium]|nr:HDOD domain-containing protein [Deltaproteobacteria bacterium]